jgi:hypothetical protein
MSDRLALARATAARTKPRLRRAILGGLIAALFLVPQADAGSTLSRGVTNPGAKYVPYGSAVGTLHTNPGGKYIYRGSGSKFHANPGGKYVYPEWQKWGESEDAPTNSARTKSPPTN